MPNSSNELRISAIRPPSPHDIAQEIARRAAHRAGDAPDARARDPLGSYVIRVSTPMTQHERLQLLAARLQRRRVALVPHPCASNEEGLERYAALA
jgi:hypothetical protein